MLNHSVVSDSSRPHGLQPTRLLRPWDFPGESTGVGCHCLLHHTVKGFGIANKAEIDIFLEFSFCFYDLADVGNLISGSSAFSKTSWNIWKFTVHALLKPGLENFAHYFTSLWDKCSSWSTLWHCLSLGLEWKLTFSSPVATAEFSKFDGILSTALSQHHLLGFEIAQLEFLYLN